MSEKICPNCYFKNMDSSDYCQECGTSLDIDEYIESKKFKKGFLSKIKSLFYGSEKTKEINQEIDNFIRFSFKFHNYEEDLINLKSNKFNKNEFKEKYKIIHDFDDFKYLEDINNDKDLNKKILLLKNVKTFYNNFDNEITKSNKLLNDINSKIHDIDKFNDELNELLNSDLILDISNKNGLVQNNKLTFDFFDRAKVKELNIDSKVKINDFLKTYENLDSIIENHNVETEIRLHDALIADNIDKAEKFVEKIKELEQTEEFITSKDVKNIKNEFNDTYDILINEDISSLNLTNDSKSNVNIFLRDFNNIKEIVEKINEELSIKILQRKVDESIVDLNQFNVDLNNLIDSNFYITFKQIDELKEEYQDLFEFIKEANEKIDISNDFKEFLTTYPKIKSIINDRNKKYVENELIEHKDFFDNIDGKSLDEKQRLAVVKNELNSQIIAGAGCGKTLTVNAKVRYLIEKKGIKPSEILCLSYSRASVKDLEEKLPDGIETATFHKLGGKILRANNKTSRPDDSALDNFIKIYFRDEVIKNEKLTEDLFEFFSYYFYTVIDENDADSIGEVYDIEESRDFSTLRNLYGGENQKITWKNEEVKSFEELVIANYLFAHQIDYDYERVYECENKNYLIHKEFVFNLIFSEFSQYYTEIGFIIDNLLKVFEIKKEIINKDYLPDFYLCDEHIYLEHFGVNRNCKALWLDEKEAQKYSDGIKWKRNLHKAYGSKLLETYSYYMSEDRLLNRLEEKLKQSGVEIKEIDFNYLISKIVEREDVNKFKDLLKLIKNFIELFKGNGYTIDKFSEFKELNKSNPKIFERKRNELFLNIVEDIYISYQNYLKQIKKIDFNDMINNATCEVKKGNLKNNYKYILVDEYQDTSHTRYNLVKAIQEKTGAKVCVVGDDWQSIYRFTGCDISLFTNFENYFENPIKLRIETTYRNSQDLIDISGKFIKKNPNQIEKTLKSKKEPKDKPVKIIYYNKKSLEDKISKMKFLIEKISEKSDKIMIIGRNNFDICPFVDNYGSVCNNDKKQVKKIFKKGKNHELIYKENEDLKIEYITVHKSKGLEEDNVILINLENKRTGFPNQIDDDEVLDFVINDSDKFEFGEERRLFYVALTRTRNNVYLLAPDIDKSVFLTELEENIQDLEILKTEDDFNESLDNPEEFMKDKNVHSIKTPLKCPVCKTGDISLILFNKGKKNLIKFFSCSHEKCDWDGGFYNSDLELLDEIEICPECGGIMQVKNGRYGPFNSCSNRCDVPKLQGEKLKRVNKILKEMEGKLEFEKHLTKLTCPDCGEGKVTLRINPKNKQKSFICSNESCDWKTAKANINISELDDIEFCPECGGILKLRNGKRGNFYGCTNFPKCRFTKDVLESNTITSKDEVKTKLKCPECGKGDVILKNKNFICSNCNWDGGSFSGDKDKLDTLEYCNNPDCNGVTFMRNGRYGDFRSCSNYFKTNCDGGKKINKSPNKKVKSSSDWKVIDAALSCPSCEEGNVILLKNKKTGRGFFKCTNNNCDWHGGSFNKSENLLDTLQYCPEVDCNGLTYEIEGKYGPFRVCTNFYKTGCKAGRSR